MSAPKARILPLLLIGWIAFSPTVPASAAVKIKFAVVPFDCRARSGGPDIGRGIASLLTSKLSDGSTSEAHIIEIQESSWESSRSRDLSKIVDLARKEDADFVIVGTVSQFDLVMNNGGSGRVALSAARSIPSVSVPYAGSISGILGSLSSNIPNRGKVQAVIEAKVVQIATGNIVLTASGTGESKHSAATLWEHKQNFGDFNSAAFGTTAAGEAAYAVVDPVVAQIQSAGQKLEDDALSFRIRGAVQDLDDPLICINAGKNAGIETRDVLWVDRPLPNFTGAKLQRVGRGITAPVCELAVSNSSENFCLAQLKQGSMPTVGDLVRKVPNGTPSEQSAYQNETVPTATYSRAVSSEIVSPTQTSHSRTYSGSADQSTQPATQPSWMRMRDNGVRYYQKGNLRAAQSMFMAALRMHPTPEGFNEISNYLNEINNNLR